MESASDPHMERLEAAVFRRLVEHLRLRQDVSNNGLVAAAGFCRNCLADWLVEASVETAAPLTVGEARHLVYGESYAAFKARQPKASADEQQRMAASLAENSHAGHPSHDEALDEELDEGFPASDPPKLIHPSRRR